MNIITHEQWFELRTKYHVALVQKYGERLISLAGNDESLLIEQLKIHDASKFIEPERTPYIELTMLYRKDGSVQMTPELLKATTHHVVNNPHHPEAWDSKADKKRLINPANRDEPIKEPINAYNMPRRYILEMVADWCAVGEERKTSPVDWANKMINKRWLFSWPQQQWIWEAINKAWK